LSRFRRFGCPGCLGLVVVLVLLLAGALLWVVFADSYRGFSEPALVELPRGMRAAEMASVLAEAGVVRHPWTFLAARALHPGAAIQAGEYRFDKPASPAEVLRRLARGDVYVIQVVIPEGSNIFDIAAILEAAGFGSASEFVRYARSNTMLIRELAPAAPSLEGYLFPSTYAFRRKATVEEIARAMVLQFRKTWESLDTAGKPVHDTVTLASLVEKETAVAEERPRVSSVFHNRLRAGMKLDCDPTVVYGSILAGRWRGVIYRSDLDHPNLYNTYRHAGLPPGPIANPGKASLQAALSPESSDYLYFVAKPGGSGEHVFSATLGAHKAAVAAYRRANGRNGKKQQQPPQTQNQQGKPNRRGDRSGSKTAR